MKQPETSPGGESPFTDPFVFGRIMLEVMNRAQPVIASYLERHEGERKDQPLDPLNISPAYIKFFNQLWSDPHKFSDLQMQYWKNWMDLCRESALKFMGEPGKTLYKPDPGDRRFKADAWQESAFFDFVKQSYLLAGRWLEQVVESAPGMDAETKHKVDFYTRQFIDAMAPSNFLLTNPEVLKETIESKGENLIRGLEHLLADLERGHGELRISTTDYSAFEVGRNLAVTPGKVVWQNRLMQLIQYEPSTETVAAVPLLIIPPWINKYYILDMRPDNSLIKWLVGQGHTVFTISWVNPDRSLAATQFEDYMREGILEAMEKIREATGQPSCNLMGYCLGGTLLAVTLAWLAEQDRSAEVASATFLTTLVDFAEAGDLKLFIDDRQLDLLEKEMAEKGYLEGAALRQTFSILRANDMIWSFVVNNYLMGREPFPFDLLYWNDDVTNMPAAMHSFYLRKLYRDNLLAKPGGLIIGDTPIRMHKIETPSYFLSTKEDHIAPWQSTYAATQMLSGPVRFVLSASGHVAGVVNPPAKNKYCYWSADENPAKPSSWLEAATQTDGSWWTNWHTWVTAYSGGIVQARKPGDGPLTIIEEAPGSYVRKIAGP